VACATGPERTLTASASRTSAASFRHAGGDAFAIHRMVVSNALEAK